MAGTTARLGLHFPDLPDLADVPADIHTLVLQLDGLAPYDQGPLVNRPLSSPGNPGIQGRFFRTTDETPSIVYVDTGTGWQPVGAIADGSIGTAQLANRSVTGIKIALQTILAENMADGSVDGRVVQDLSITASELATSLKPSQGAGSNAEALRSLGTGPGQAAFGHHGSQHLPGGADPIDEEFFPTVPIGGVIDWPYASGSIPSWSLLALGQGISRANYPRLHVLAAASGYPHGPGDGINTFNIPDYRGRAGIGKDDMGGIAANRVTVAISGVSGAVLGAVGGSEGVTLTTAQIPSHSHGLPVHIANGSASDDATYKLSDHYEGVSSFAAGGGGSHTNVQPVIVVNKIIRVL